MAPTPFNITHILAPAPNGGLERVVEMLAAGQVAGGSRVSAVTIVAGGAVEVPVIDRLRRAGVAVSVMRVSGRAYARERGDLAAILATRPRGVIHTHGYRADVLYAPVAKRLGFATVSTFHGFTGGDWKNRLYETLQRRAARGIHRVVGVSKPIVEQLRASGVDERRLRFIANAYAPSEAVLPQANARAALGLPADAFIIGWVGRLSREKAADVLVAASAQLTDLPLTVVFVGDGPEAETLRRQAKGLVTGGTIRWAGAINGMGPLYGAFDAVVISSRTEGTPIVLFEAMAAGVPVITTFVGGIPDVVTANEAILVAPESPTQLAAAVRTVFSRRDEASQRAASAATVLSSRFGLDPWVDRYAEVYQEAQGAVPATR